MNTMTFAPARHNPLADFNPLALAGEILRGLARAFAPRQPAAPARLSWRQRAAEAAQVRRMAMAMQHVDPGMAGDLFAAADRHQLDA